MGEGKETKRGNKDFAQERNRKASLNNKAYRGAWFSMQPSHTSYVTWFNMVGVLGKISCTVDGKLAGNLVARPIPTTCTAMYRVGSTRYTSWWQRNDRQPLGKPTNPF